MSQKTESNHDSYKLVTHLLAMGFSESNIECVLKASDNEIDDVNSMITVLTKMQYDDDKSLVDDNQTGVNLDKDMNEKKYAHAVSNVLDEDDCQEVLVTGKDLRVPVYDSKHRGTDIIQCIGELRVEYKYNSYRLVVSGTGTVFHVKRNNQKLKAYLLTCAHNIRHFIYECQICNTYAEKKKEIACKHVVNHIMLKACKIEFRRRITQKRVTQMLGNGLMENKMFGDMEELYECKCEYIDDVNYEKYPYTKSGYDWAILSFTDHDCYYADKTKHILIRNGVKTLEQCQNFNIFGYPMNRHKMYGMGSSGEAFKVQIYPSTNKSYLTQKEIDTRTGQSGSAVWNKPNNIETIIFGIHTGGSMQNKYNVAVLIDDQILYRVGFIMFYNEQKIWRPLRLLLNGRQATDEKIDLIQEIRKAKSFKCRLSDNWLYHAVMLFYLKTPVNDNDVVVSVELCPERGTGIFGGYAKVFIKQEQFGNFSKCTFYQEREIKDKSYDEIKLFCDEYTEKKDTETFSFWSNNCRKFACALCEFLGIPFDCGLW